MCITVKRGHMAVLKANGSEVCWPTPQRLHEDMPDAIRIFNESGMPQAFTICMYSICGGCTPISNGICIETGTVSVSEINGETEYSPLIVYDKLE